MATYAVGDIQGCFDELIQLLDLCGFNPKKDRLWLVGDLVNRGPKSLEVLRFVKQLGERAQLVLGNHDLHLIMRSQGFGKDNKEDTLAPILSAPDAEELITWLRSQPLLHVEDGYAMVHAGLLPQWTLSQAKDLAEEVSAALRADNYVEFLSNMWGSKPDRWSDELTGWDRLRVVVNAMTRMRFCSEDGVMEFKAKGPPDHPPKDCLPWFEFSKCITKTHTLVFGHWSALGLRVHERMLALDSGCLWGGALSAVRLEDRKVFQLPCLAYPKPQSWE